MTQLWGHSRISGRSCILACLQVPLISFFFPEPPSGTLTPSWWDLHKVGCWRVLGRVGGDGQIVVLLPQSIHVHFQLKFTPLYWAPRLGVDLTVLMDQHQVALKLWLHGLAGRHSLRNNGSQCGC